jgi:hypothetical protein
MTEVIAHQRLGSIARKALNPAKIAVSLAWYDRAFENYYIAGHFPAEQKDIDRSTFVPDGYSNKIGTGKTIKGAVESLETQFFGGL